MSSDYALPPFRFDDAWLDALFLALPVSWCGTIESGWTARKWSGLLAIRIALPVRSATGRRALALNVVRTFLVFGKDWDRASEA